MIFNAWDESCSIWRAALTAERVSDELRDRVTKRAQQIHRDAFMVSVLGERPYADRVENGQPHFVKPQFVNGAIEAAIRKTRGDDDDGC